MSSSRPAGPLSTATDLLAAERAGRRCEIIGGELVEKAAPSPEHGSAQFALSGMLFGPFGRRSGGSGPGGWWLMTEVEVQYEAHELFRHDLVGWRREQHHQRPDGKPVSVRPDWVCEILSTSNASNDTVRKLRVLHRANVPHYWLVDPERLTLTVLRWTPDGYLEALAAAAPETVRAEPFEAIEMSLATLFDFNGS